MAAAPWCGRHTPCSCTRLSRWRGREFVEPGRRVDGVARKQRPFSREAGPKRGVTMRFRVSRLAAALVFGFLLTSSTSALATTRWVNDPPNTYLPPGTSCTNPGYPTIGAAVAAAVSGDTIRVCDGMYTENVILNKSLMLLVAQAGMDACGRVASESILTPSNPLVRT